MYSQKNFSEIFFPGLSMDNGSACASIEFDTKDLPKAENIPTVAGLSIQTWWGSYLLRSYLAPWLLLRVHNVNFAQSGTN